MSSQIIVHGGAGNNVKNEHERFEICKRAVVVSTELLKAGKSAVDVCETAVKILEDAPHLNAGTGSYLQLDGRIRMDACLMTSKMDLGAVIQVSNIKNPITLARKIMESIIISRNEYFICLICAISFFIYKTNF